MKRLFWIIMLVSLLVSVAVAQPQPPILLEAEDTILVGETWELRITVKDALAGDSVDVMLLNGLKRFNDTLQLGSGGVATWRIGLNNIMQAGTSLAVVHYNDYQVSHQLIVLPAIPSVVDLYTTANAMFAYGNGLATLMILPRDQWGNAALGFGQFRAAITVADGTQQQITFNYDGGLGWYDLTSQGDPGRVRINMEQGQLTANLEVMQTPEAARTIRLSISPDCVVSDGRDVISLVADVTDSFGNAVADGTNITFVWADGLGYGQTNAGRAALRLPSPSQPGRYEFRATGGIAESQPQTLTVTTGTCRNE